MANEERRRKENGILQRIGLDQQGRQDFMKGWNDAFDVSGEDRRRQITNFRESYQDKAEATAASLRVGTIPGVDVLRQVKTVNQNIPAAERNIFNEIKARLPVPAYTPGNWAHRQFVGMNIGRDDIDANFPEPIKGQHDFADVDKHSAEVQKELQGYNAKIRALPAMQKAGHSLATVADEIQSNGVRSLWWLINAPQAIVDLASEGIATAAAPDLRGTVELKDLNKAVETGDLKYVGEPTANLKDQAFQAIGRKLGIDDLEVTQSKILSRLQSEAQLANNGQLSFDEADAIARKNLDTEIALEVQTRDQANRLDPGNYVAKKPGVQKISKGRGTQSQWRKRRFAPNAAGLMSMLPASVAINGGMGLFHRPEGYGAVMANENDPRQSDNMLAEVAARYLIGRSGKLLPYDEFNAERPDVAPDDYAKYKVYKYGKDWDINPFDDGKLSLFNGTLKANIDGIHGAELEFLGRNLGWNETLLPTIAALGGTAVGAAIPNIRSYRLKKQAEAGYGESVNPYEAATWKDQPLKKVVGNIPEPAPRNEAGQKFVNPAWKKGGKLSGINAPVEKVEKFFEYEPKQGQVGPPSIRKRRVLGAMIAGGAAGLLGGTLIGKEQENRRREAKFKERFPMTEYEPFKQRVLDRADRQYDYARNNPEADAAKEKYGKTSARKRNEQSELSAEITSNNVQINSLVDEERRKRAQQLQQQSVNQLKEIKAIEDAIWENSGGGNSM